MKKNIVLEPDGIPIDYWIALCKTGIWLVNQTIKQSFSTRRMLNEWRKIIMVLFHKNEGDIKKWNKKSIKLTSHITKICKRTLERERYLQQESR